MKMQNLKTKSKLSAIAFVIILTFAATFVALPSVSAHDPAWEIPTYAYISVRNNPIGLNQELLIIFWPNAVPPTAVGAYGDRWTWNVEITKPDGSTETLGPITSDPIGGGYAVYTPTEVGTYTIVAVMEDHVITGLPVPPGGYFMGGAAAIGDLYLGDTSDPVTLVVQEEPISAWQETPVTNDYWTRPINDMNREWYVLAGNWLAGAAQNNGPTSNFGYGKGPESAHIMWATPIWAGGIMDARFGDTGYQTAHYEGLSLSPPIILNGKIFYNVMSLPREGYRVLDLYTGEELWFMNSTGPVTGTGGGFDASGEISGGRLSFGQIYNYDSPNQHGGFPYIWSVIGNTMYMYDAETGSYICSINNVPSWAGIPGFFYTGGPPVYGKDGSLTWYNIVGTPNPMGPFFPSTPPFYLQIWNTSRAIWYEDTWLSNEYWMWRPTLNETFDGNNGYSLNVSIPNVQGSIQCVREGEYVIGGVTGKNNGTYVQDGHLWALSLEPGKEGTLLWNITFTPPQGPPDISTGSFGMGGMTLSHVDPEDGVFLFSESITRRWWAYNLTTGQMLWGPSDPEPSGNYYGMYSNIYQGKLLSCGYGGKLIAYNITTGDVLWEYTASQEGYESPYGNYPIGIAVIADGKLYLTSSEHSPTQPLWRGSYLRCINATDGTEIWKINNWGLGMGPGPEGSTYIADGYIVTLNAYDNRIYCYGKGPSETTVSVQNDVIAKGSSVMITGTVTDQSPGAKGTPAISDEDMSDWMEYMYMQQPMPDAQGVKVKLYSIDPNNNYQDIGEATTDIAGNFGISWMPPVEGDYWVMAQFEGSASYGSSYDTTYFTVNPAPAAAAPMEPEQPEPTAPEPTEPTPTEPEPTQSELATPEPTTPEPTEPTTTEAAEAPLITTELAIVIAVVVIAVVGVVAFWALRKRK
jgi:hypothetical protein